MTAAVDPVTAHVAELDRVLSGPGAVKRSMIAELRDGLHDAAAAHREGGLDPQRAAAVAVQDFGSVPEIAPALQEELTARQGRHTALLLAVVFPAMLIGWDLLWRTGHGWSAPPSTAVLVLARVLDGATVLITAAALLLLLATFRRSVAPGRVTALAGLVAAVGVLGCSAVSVVMNLVGPQVGGESPAAQPAVVLVAVASAVASVLVVRSATLSLRAARAPRTYRARSDERSDPQVG